MATLAEQMKQSGVQPQSGGSLLQQMQQAGIQPTQKIEKKGNVFGRIGNAIIKSEKGFGETLGTALATPLLKQQEEVETSQDMALLNQVQQKLKDPNVSREQKQRLLETAQRMGQSTIGNVEAVQKSTKQIIGEGAGVLTDVLGAGSFGKAVPTVFSGGIKQGILRGAGEGAVFGAAQQASQAAQDDMSGIDIAAEGLKGGFTGGLVGGAIGGITSGVGSLVQKVQSRRLNSVDDVFDEIQNVLPESSTKGFAAVRRQAEKSAPRISFSEARVGLRPDIKKQLQKAGPEITAEYADVTMARNVDASLPSVAEHAGNYVVKARDNVVKQLQDTGSEIGQFRQKVSTVKVPQEKVSKAVELFDEQLDGLNLRVQNGVISQKPGTVVKTKPSEINVLNTFRNNLNTLKQSPTIKNIIDNRVAFDNTINFGKSSGDVTGIVDPLSRKMRAYLADVNRSVIGKEQSEMLEKYSQLIEAIEEMNRYIDRQAGAEYLLKRVLSERGGEARKLIETIKEISGVDLLDHAVLMRTMTDILGNDSQKSLLQSAIKNAGLDVATFLRGDKLGMAKAIGEKTLDKFIDPEKVIRRASKTNLGN